MRKGYNLECTPGQALYLQNRNQTLSLCYDVEVERQNDGDVR